MAPNHDVTGTTCGITTILKSIGSGMLFPKFLWEHLEHLNDKSPFSVLGHKLLFVEEQLYAAVFKILYCEYAPLAISQFFTD